MPIPPPPAVLFSIRGNPIPADAAIASSREPTNPVPGQSGTPAATASSRAVCFSPNFRIASGDGPSQTQPSASMRSANSAFSLSSP